VIIFKEGIVFILMHRFNFPMVQYFMMKEFGTFRKVCNAEMDSGTVGNFSRFVVCAFYLFYNFYD